MSLTVLRFPHPALRYPAVPIKVTDEVRQLVKDMARLMRESNGIGLAAPQIGYPWRLFVCNPRNDRPEGEELVFVNPVLTPSVRHGSCLLEEGCLSIPGLYRKVSRPRVIDISWQDLDGNEHKTQYGGWTARVIQHEYAHLLGELFIDLIPSDPDIQQRLQFLVDEYALGRASGAIPEEHVIEESLKQLVERINHVA